MQFAKDRRTGQLVEASSARRSAFLCPVCGGGVFLRAGRTREPHFAHYSGQGASDCEQYHPGRLSGSVVSGAGPEVEDSPESLGLALAMQGDTWQLLLRLPEIPNDELGKASLQELVNGRIEVSCSGSRVIRVSALDLRPGVSVAHAEVPPSQQEYRSSTQGRWPESIKLERWSGVSPGLTEAGTLFRLRAGEWTRLREHSPVAWGEPLVLVADESKGPPEATIPEPAERSHSDGRVWRLWRLKLPAIPNPRVSTWVRALGHEVRMPPWRIRILSVPIALSPAGPQFAVNTPLVAELVAPSPTSRATISATLGSNAHTSHLNAPPGTIAFAELSSDTPAPGVLEIIDNGVVTESFEFVRDDAFVDAASFPRLRVRIGSAEWEPWRSPTPGGANPNDEVEVEVGVGGVRLDVVAWLLGGQRIFRTRATVPDAVRFLVEMLPKAQLLEIDGGNFGRVRIPVTPHPARESVGGGRSRLSAWLGVVASATKVNDVTSAPIDRWHDGHRSGRLSALPSWVQVLTRASARRTR